MEERRLNVLTFRPTPDVMKAWERFRATRSGPANEAFAELVNWFDKETSARLDPDALALYQQGKLDRAAWGKACLRYQQRKQTQALSTTEHTHG